MKKAPLKRKDDPRTLEIQKDLYSKIKIIANEKELGMAAAAYMIGCNAGMGTRMNKNQDMFLYSFIRLADILGYELVLAKSNMPLDWSKDKVLLQRYEKYKTQQLNAKRKERGLPENGERLIRVRTKGKPARESRVVIISRKSIKDVHNEQDDIFKLT